ncbi:MAG: DUF4625 domain-containing protein [Solitalea-like symbiont of Acarus siro]
MKSLKKSFITLFSLLAVSAIVFACIKHDKAPTITITAPTSTTSVIAGEAVSLTADLKSDKENLKDYTYSVHPKGKHSTNTVAPVTVDLASVNSKAASVNKTITIPAGTTAGKYDVVLKARDKKDKEGIVTVEITVTAKSNN